MSLSPVRIPGAGLGPRIFTPDEASAGIRTAVQAYERTYGTEFGVLTWFGPDYLAGLHDEAIKIDMSSIVQPEQQTGVAEALEVMGQIANRASAPDLAARRRYRQALLDLYGQLSVSPRSVMADEGALCVAPEREGRQLAEWLDCLPAGRSFRPNAKRIPFGGGLLVGLSEPPELAADGDCVIIDGAIASGATLIALLSLMSSRTDVGHYHVFAAHSSQTGVRAICRFVQDAGIGLTVHVAAVSGHLNEKFYATDASDSARLSIGDVGDMLEGL